jgi:hypothetical protein
MWISLVVKESEVVSLTGMHGTSERGSWIILNCWSWTLNCIKSLALGLESSYICFWNCWKCWKCYKCLESWWIFGVRIKSSLEHLELGKPLCFVCFNLYLGIPISCFWVLKQAILWISCFMHIKHNLSPLQLLEYKTFSFNLYKALN